MRTTGSIIALLLIGVFAARGAEFDPSNASYLQNDVPPIVLAVPPPAFPAPGDSTPVAHSRLLPENTSWMERALWGENGLVRKVGIAGDLTPETRKHELTVRRTMLTMHQIGGFLTWGLMVASCVTGQRMIDGNLGVRGTHNSLVGLTIASYAATGLLAILSPPPLIRREETSTTTIHKTLAWVHVAGMILTPIIGSMVTERGGDRQAGVRTLQLNDQKARFHQIAAYSTTAVFTLSMVVLVF